MSFWAELCEDPVLRNLPYKIETNRFNKIIMSPASNWHGGFQSEIGYLFTQLMPHGKAISECAVETTDGVKVADVAWITRERLAPYRRAVNMPIAPEICVEIVSPSNSREEMLGKMQLYFSKGAQEVWLCYESGTMEFFVHDDLKPISQSRLCPAFPQTVEWD